MKLARASVAVIVTFAIICAVIIFPPKSKKADEDVEFLDFKISAKAIDTAEEIAGDITRTAALAIPRPIRSILRLYGVPFSMVEKAFKKLGRY